MKARARAFIAFSTLAVMLSAAAAACFVDIDESLLLRAADDGGPVAAVGDGGSETSSGGGPTDGEALADGNITPLLDGGGVDAKGVCSGATAFCDDFERAPSNVVGPWSQSYLTPAGSVTIEGPAGARFLRTHLNASAGQGGQAALAKDFGLVSTSARVSALIRHNIDTDTSNAELLTITFRQGAGKCQGVILAYRSNAVRLVQENPCESGNAPDVAFNLVKGSFQRVELSVTIGGMVEVLLDGVSVAKTNTAAFIKSGTITLSAGLSYSGANGDVAVDIDDVAFTSN